jgi:non-homologous end joining protein Ku
VLHLIEQKIRRADKRLPPAKKGRKPTNVIDLVSVLQKSLKETQKRKLKKAA